MTIDAKLGECEICGRTVLDDDLEPCQECGELGCPRCVMGGLCPDCEHELYDEETT